MPFPTSSRYRDFSKVADEEVRIKFSSMVGRSQESFPIKLHKIIDQIERDGLSSILSWCAHGRAFKIHNNTLFVKDVMSRYFYQTKMSSFTRQLGMHCTFCVLMQLWLFLIKLRLVSSIPPTSPPVLRVPPTSTPVLRVVPPTSPRVLRVPPTFSPALRVPPTSPPVLRVPTTSPPVLRVSPTSPPVHQS